MGNRRECGTPPRDAKPMPPLTTMAQHYNNTTPTSRADHIHNHVHYDKYTREDNICASIAVVGIVCLTSHLSQHRRRLSRLFAIEYFNENYSLHPGIIHNICFQIFIW